MGALFVSDQVGTQLAAQQIYFPERGSDALADPAIKPYVSQYAVFKGETLRGQLLNAHAFGQMATIAFYGAMPTRQTIVLR